MQTKIKTLRRDPAIELVRLLGCLIVIGCHTTLSYQNSDATWNGSRLFLAMLFADGVGVFWLIGGAFFFENTDYKKLMIRSLKKVFIPMLAVGVIYLLLDGYVTAGDADSILQSIKNSSAGWANVFYNMIRWRNGVDGYGHSWYVYIYMMLMLCFPILKSFVDYLDQSSKKIMVWAGITISIFILNDITKNSLMSFSHYTINGLIPAIGITIIGHYLYRFRSRFRNNYWLAFSIVLFLSCNVIRKYIQQSRVIPNGETDISIMYWYSFLGILCASAVMIFGLAVIRNNHATGINRLICFLASYTFPIYLIHILVRNELRNLQIDKMIMECTIGNLDNIIGESLYSVLFVGLIFIISFALVFLYRMIKKGLTKAFHYSIIKLTI